MLTQFQITDRKAFETLLGILLEKENELKPPTKEGNNDAGKGVLVSRKFDTMTVAKGIKHAMVIETLNMGFSIAWPRKSSYLRLTINWVDERDYTIQEAITAQGTDTIRGLFPSRMAAVHNVGHFAAKWLEAFIDEWMLTDSSILTFNKPAIERECAFYVELIFVNTKAVWQIVKDGQALPPLTSKEELIQTILKMYGVQSVLPQILAFEKEDIVLLANQFLKARRVGTQTFDCCRNTFQFIPDPGEYDPWFAQSCNARDKYQTGVGNCFTFRVEPDTTGDDSEDFAYIVKNWPVMSDFLVRMFEALRSAGYDLGPNLAGEITAEKIKALIL